MRRLIPMFIGGGIALAQATLIASSPAQPSATHSLGTPAAAASFDLPPMPAFPTGETTILGGAIRNVDPVLDRFTLDIYGERPMTIEFDERTKVFRDGVSMPLGKLGPADHASIQTALDGTHVLAESIHILSRAPRGELQGVVRSYDRQSGKLEVDSDLSPNSLKFFLPVNTPIARVGQPEFTSVHSGATDLRRGSLIAISFAPDLHGRAVVQHITVMAVPGSSFLFGGNVSFLDLASGSLVLVDSRDGKSYRIYFDFSRFPSASKLHVGDNVTVDANYEGTRYVATTITVN
ncbi:MAG TPA: hypothetical protein VFW83_08705 [Bryobacteraceae bacterium]|nr:hypothetical protein [Bryobacteraceae bacterium]